MNAALTELREIRENNFRKSATVVQLWDSVIAAKIHKLGHEKWVILEQVLIAALDVGKFELAQTCIDQLRKRFPESCRVKRLYGMCLEALNKFDEASDIYNQLITKEETDIVSRKRLVTIYKAQGSINQAIEELNKYLKTFMADVEAWGELGDLYLAQGDYKRAAFCVEEVILANPHNHLLHERLAEIKYSEGGTENMELARAYFAHACRINPQNVRALYGLILAASSLSGKISEKLLISLTNDENTNTPNQQYSLPPFSDSLVSRDGNIDSKRENHQLIVWAISKLKRIYADAGLNAPISIANMVRTKIGSASRENIPSRQKGDHTGLVDSIERLSLISEDSPRHRKK